MNRAPETVTLRSDGDGGWTTSDYLSTKHSTPVEYIRKDVYDECLAMMILTKTELIEAHRR